MSSNKRGLHDTPCEECYMLAECEERAADDTCRAFRRYACKGQYKAPPWKPEDRGVFDGMGVGE